MGRHHHAGHLQHGLDRLSAALERPSREQRRRHRGGGTLLLVGLGLLAGAILGDRSGLYLPAFVLLALGGASVLRHTGRGLLERMNGGRDPSRASIGVGATVAADARVEPGAVVEMGATVGSGAVVEGGAVVRMGADVRAGAVVESGAVIGWGATVRKRARVGAGAVVGAGATVEKDAVVPAQARLLAGSVWSSGAALHAPPAPQQPAAIPDDPREARIAAACARIEAELAQASPAIREHLGGSARIAASLRSTCDELLARERILRSESSPEGLAFLGREQEELVRRAGVATDERVRSSLESAAAAIADQLRQRGQLAAAAERIDAELTRLSWTLDGLAAQLVRLRTAGEPAPSAGEAMDATVRQLHDEIDAISEALEEANATSVRPPERVR